MNVDKSADSKVVGRPQIVFGGINNGFVSTTHKLLDKNILIFFLNKKAHARNTEEFLTGKSLKDESVLASAVDTLAKEVEPDYRPEDGSVEYRKLLPQTLLYKVTI